MVMSLVMTSREIFANKTALAIPVVPLTAARLRLRLQRRFLRGRRYLLFLHNLFRRSLWCPSLLVDLNHLADLDRFLDLERLVGGVSLAEQQRPEIESPRLQEDSDEVPVGKRGCSVIGSSYKKLATVGQLTLDSPCPEGNTISHGRCNLRQSIELKLHRGSSSIVHTYWP